MEKMPHPVFVAVWLLWLACVLAALAYPGAPRIGLIVLLAFLPLEAVAVAWSSGKRDTLSEITTWVYGRLSKHRRFAQGWMALLLVQVVAVAYLLFRTVEHYSGSWLLAAAFGVLTGIWLDNHWRLPTEHG